MRLLSLVLLFIVTTSSAQLKPQYTSTEDRAIVTAKKVVIVRPPGLIKDFPHKTRATVTYPVISGLKDPKVLKHVQSILRIKNAFGTSLAEYREDTWLEEFGYKVNFNRNNILDITFTQSGSGAYPDTHTKHFAINLKTGSIIKASDVFEQTKLESLAAMVNRNYRVNSSRL